MANGYKGSRSPVRAIYTAHPSGGSTVATPRSWGEPLARELPAAEPVSYPEAENHSLSCPECGSVVRLTLTLESSQPPQPQRLSPLTLQPAPAHDEAPDFEESIRRHKRSLIVAALERNGGVMTQTAKALGLKYTTFVAMVHRLGVLERDAEPAVR